MPLHTDKRPTRLKDIQGNFATRKSLKAAVEDENRSHCYLFIGNPGCGKTTLARVMAHELGIIREDETADKSLNFKELDAADFRGIDTIREIKKIMRMTGIGGGLRGFLFDECHQLTPQAQEALLKSLENAPDHVYFFLATTEPQKLKSTLKRRCSTYGVLPLPQKAMVQFLKNVCEEEKKKVPEKYLIQLSEDSLGSCGQALMSLSQIIDLKPKTMAKAIKQKEYTQHIAVDLARALFNKSSWDKLIKILADVKGDDAEGIRRLMMAWCRNALLKNANSRAFLIMQCFQEPFYQNGFDDLLMACAELYFGE